MQNVTRRNRRKMPAVRPANKVPDVPKNINVAFRRQLLNPDDAMLEEQSWRLTGIGGQTIYDGGGDDEDTISDGEVQLDDSKPNEPQSFHIREYESRGRKISRDVRVVSQGLPNTDDKNGPEMVPHLLLPLNNNDRTSHVPLNGNETNRVKHSRIPNRDADKSPHLHAPNSRNEGPPHSPSKNSIDDRTPGDPQTFHIREYESPGRKISRDVRVVNQGQTDGRNGPEVVPHLLLPYGNEERMSHLYVHNGGSDKRSQRRNDEYHLKVPNEGSPSTPLSSESDVRNPAELQMFHIREYESPGRKISRDVRVVSQDQPSVGDMYEAVVVPQVYHPDNNNHGISHLQVPDSGSNMRSGSPSAQVPNDTTHRTAYILYGESSSEEDRGTLNQSLSNTTAHKGEYENPEQKIKYDVKVEHPVTGGRDKCCGSGGLSYIGHIKNNSGQPPDQSDPNRFAPTSQNESSAHITETPQYHQNMSDLAQKTSQSQNPNRNHHGYSETSVHSIREEHNGTVTDRTVYLDTNRTTNSLPQSTYRRKLEDYYNFDQPRESIVDPRSYQNAKRASRASVLSKAELLLRDRRMGVVNEMSSDDEVHFPVKGKPRRRGSPYKRGGHSTDTEVVLKVKSRDKTLTSPEAEQIQTPRLRKPRKYVPKRKPFVQKRPPNVPKRQTLVHKQPVKKQNDRD